jgi:hypothetical protein
MSTLEASPLEQGAEKENGIDIHLLFNQMETDIFRSKMVIETFVSLVEKLGEKLPTYDTILSDDASGRLMSLVLRKVIDETRRREGKEGTNTYFLAMGRWDFESGAAKFLRNKKSEIKKALVVTEYIQSGNSMGKSADILDGLGISFDIATLSIRRELDDYPENISRRLIYGLDNSELGLRFWNDSFASGVEKTYAEGSAHPGKTTAPQDKARDEVAKARRDVDRLAEALKEII